MAAPKVKKSEHNRHLILEAAKRLIAERGFNAITLQDVLEAASITKGKFFHYFSGKEDLFQELLRYVMAERDFLVFDEELRSCEDQAPFAQLLFIIDRVIEWHDGGLPESMRLLVFATFVFPLSSPEMQEMQKRLQANSKTLQRLLHLSQENGELPKELDPALFSLLFPSVAIGGNLIGHLAQKKRVTNENLILLKTILIQLRRGIRGNLK